MDSIAHERERERAPTADNVSYGGLEERRLMKAELVRTKAIDKSPLALVLPPRRPHCNTVISTEGFNSFASNPP
jgi:hypothetical protein